MRNLFNSLATQLHTILMLEMEAYLFQKIDESTQSQGMLPVHAHQNSYFSGE